LVKELILIGFKEYEAKVLTVLLKGIPMSASQIAKEAKLIRNSIYDTLQSFAEKGYCNEIETNTVNKYQIIDPKVIADKIEHELKSMSQERIDSLRATFSEAQDIYRSSKKEVGEPDIIELIRGFNKHRVQKYIELIRTAKTEILTMNRLRGLVSPELDNFTKKFIRNGGIVRSIYKSSLDFKVMKYGKPVNAVQEDLINVLRKFESIGEKIRVSESNIPNLVIIDREKTFVHITGKSISARNKQTDLIVNDKDYTANMLDLFEFYWGKAITINEFTKKEK
jgi:sugar-specific transcriptional regulator TrmB